MVTFTPFISSEQVAHWLEGVNIRPTNMGEFKDYGGLIKPVVILCINSGTPLMKHGTVPTEAKGEMSGDGSINECCCSRDKGSDTYVPIRCSVVMCL